MKFILTFCGVLVVFAVALVAIPDPAPATQSWRGVCLYEVVIDASQPLITVGWSDPPCGPIDIHDTAQHDALKHSWFLPECTLVTIDAHPDNPYPVVEYAPSCPGHADSLSITPHKVIDP